LTALSILAELVPPMQAAPQVAVAEQVLLVMALMHQQPMVEMVDLAEAQAAVVLALQAQEFFRFTIRMELL
jgi:hypothetical protein